MCINVWVVLSSQQDKLKNHALNNIHNMASQFIVCFWKPHLAFPYSPPSSGTASTILYSLAPSNSCSLLFSLGNPWQKGGVFFSEDPSAKLGFLPLSSLRWDRQVAPRTSAAVSEPRCRHSPCLSSLFPSRDGIGVSCPLLGTCQHSTAHTQEEMEGLLFSCSHRVWTLLSRGCETPQCFVLLNVGFWPVSNASP